VGPKKGKKAVKLRGRGTARKRRVTGDTAVVDLVKVSRHRKESVTARKKKKHNVGEALKKAAVPWGTFCTRRGWAPEKQAQRRKK